MAFYASVLKVMIASPGDVAAEREIITQELYRWNNANAVTRALMLQPVKWETHSSPQMGDHPQNILNERLLIDADIVVGIFGTRIGTATPSFISGTVEEIKTHVAAGKLAMLYFSHVPIDPHSINQDQWTALQLFKEECKTGGLYAEYSSHDQLRTDFGHHLAIELNRPKYLWLPKADSLVERREPELNDNEKQLLIACASDRDGNILTGQTMQGFYVQSNNRNFVDSSARSVAAWKRALRNLEVNGYISQLNDDLYQITDEGFGRADKEIAATPLQIEVSFTGSPDKQNLAVRSTKPVRLLRIEFLLSSEALISSSDLEIEVEGKAEIPLDYSKIVALFNAPRPDRNHFDLSGPAILRLVFASGTRQYDPLLPVLLQPQVVNNTNWIQLVGSKSFFLT